MLEKKEFYRCLKQGDEPGIWKFELWDKEHEKWIPSNPEIVIKEATHDHGRLVIDQLKRKIAMAMMALLLSGESGDDVFEECNDAECKTKTPTGEAPMDDLVQLLFKRIKEKGGNN
jgi:hypothetical protein